MIKTFLGGNWKMNKTDTETGKFLDDIIPMLDLTKNIDVVIFPPFTSLKTADLKRNSTALKLGAQDVSKHISGAFTGQISAAMLADLNVEYVLVGQYETRLFGVSDEDVNQKLLNALKYNIKPILCVGDTFEEKESGTSNQVVKNQVMKGIDSVTTEQFANVTICYEPVWALGTGKTCSPQQAQEMCEFIRELIKTRVSADVAYNIRIIYGGSVNTGNVREFDEKPDISGLLCGGVSLKLPDFAQILYLMH